MITKCQHTGIEFEANSKRTKMHPQIAAIKNEAAKTGNYREVMAALAAAENETWTTIEEAIEFINDMAAGRIGARRQADREAGAAKKAAERERLDIAQRRRERNNKLRAHGYRWTKENEESMDFAGATAIDTLPANGWTLTAPDGRIVTVEQAMSEIANS